MKVRYLTILTMLAFVGFSVPAAAHCVDDGVHSGDHPHCTKEAGPAGGGEYDVTVVFDLLSATRVGLDGGGKSKPVNVSFQFIDLDLSFFEDEFKDGKHCFIATPLEGHLTAMTISQEKDLSAYVQYWFTGYGDDGSTEVGYLLEMFGGFDGEWRPADTTTVILTSWEMGTNNTGKAKKIACTSSSPAPFSTNIEVTRTN